MQQNFLIIGAMFSAIPLVMINFDNRCAALANFIRHLIDQVIHENVSPVHVERFLSEIKRLRDRVILIGVIQSCAANSFILALSAMIAGYFNERLVSSFLFLGPVLLFTRESQIDNIALDVHLSNLESHQEW